LHVKYPPKILATMTACRPLIDTGEMFFHANCEGLGTFQIKWLLGVVVQPLLMLLVILGLFIFSHCLGADHAVARSTLAQRFVFVIFFCYPAMITYSATPYQCTPISPKDSVLDVDDRILCEDASMVTIRVVSYFIILLVCIGVPVFFAFILHRASQKSASVEQVDLIGLADKLCLDQDVAKTVCSEIVTFPTFLSTLKVQAYRPRYTYWTCIDCLRKLALLGIVGFVGDGTMVQWELCCVSAFCFLMLHAKAWPFKSNADNMFQAAVEIQVFWIITMGVVAKFDLSRESVQSPAYDWALFISFILIVPVGFVATVVFKYRVAHKKGLFVARGVHGAALRHMEGLASDFDRHALRQFIQQHACDSSRVLPVY
jgi:hypothetical protein